jgi:hypothetical protein
MNVQRYLNEMRHGHYSPLTESQDGQFVLYYDYATLLASHNELIIEHAALLINHNALLGAAAAVARWWRDDDTNCEDKAVEYHLEELVKAVEAKP